MSRDQKKIALHNTKSLDYLKQTIGRNVDVKDVSGDSSKGNKEHSRENFIMEDTDNIMNKMFVEI